MSKALIARARELRQSPARGESELWVVLRGGVFGVRFYRQRVIGPFIADFACLSARLVIEIDGSVHATQVERDAERQEYLEARGHRVLRFTPEEVECALGATLARITAALTTATPRPTTAPLSSRERGERQLG